MYTLESSIQLAKEYLGKQYFDNLKIKYQKVDKKSTLVVNKNNDNVEIQYGEIASLFFALTLIKRHHKKESFNINLNRHFLTNGLMHDCSRNGPLNIKQAKEMIMVLSLFGLNRFMLYTEDVYEIEGEPFFGYLRGKYSKEELKDLDAYARSFGVELVPCIQTLSHLYAALKWPAFAEVRDTANTLMAGEEKTYAFIDKMLATCQECFSSKNINICMDEAFDIASGPFIWQNKVYNKKELFLSHLNRVVELCKKRGFTPMMWCDMFFGLEFRKDGEFLNWRAFRGKLSQETKDLIPDVQLIYWDYYSDKEEVYDNFFKACLDTKKETIFADGAYRWIGFAPNIIQSLENTKVGLKSAMKNNVKEILITSWGDNGNESSAISSYPAMAMHAMFDFYGKSNEKELSKILETVTGDPLSRWALLQEPNHLRKEQVVSENLSRAFFYQDILLGVVDCKVKEEYSDIFKENALRLKKASKKSAQFGYFYNTLSLFCDFLANKSTIGLRLRKAYKSGDKKTLESLKNEILVCEKKLAKFLNAYRYQWYLENKPFGFDIIDGRIGFLNNRMHTAYLTVNDYLQGRIKNIPELEEEIQPWQGTNIDDPICIGNWTELASVNGY